MSPVLSYLPKKFFAVTSLQQFPIKVWKSKLLVRRKRNCKREFKAELLPSDVTEMSRVSYFWVICVCTDARLQNTWGFLGFLITKFKITVGGDLMVAVVPFIADKLTSQ